jgi:hypothetical protein
MSSKVENLSEILSKHVEKSQNFIIKKSKNNNKNISSENGASRLRFS